MDFSVGNNDKPLRLLIIDGDHARAECLTTLLRQFGYTLKAARLERAREALAALQKHAWDLVLIDTDFVSKNTLISFAKLARQKYHAPLLSYSESQQDATAIRLTLENGARDFLCLDDPQRMQQIVSRELDDLRIRRTLLHYEQLFVKQLQLSTIAQQASDDAKNAPPETAAAVQNQVEIAMPDGETDADNSASLPETTAPENIPRQEKSLLTQQHDPLTGLYSPAYFLGALKQSLSSSDAGEVGLLHMEIDNIDQHRTHSSPEIIQILLSETAGLLCQLQSKNCIASYCDDASFTLLLKDRNRDEILTVAKALRKLIHDHDFSHLDPNLKSVSCSIGLCLREKHSAADAERLISQAHHACNRALQNGGNRICAYEKQAKAATRYSPGSWPARIKQALRDDRFSLVFQPIISLNSTANEYYELFLRMLDDDNNEILPEKFLLAAEENTMMAGIDRWVTYNSMIKLVENHANKGYANFFIKVSTASILDRNFLPWLVKNLHHSRGISSHLTFEINEADLLRYPEETRTFIRLLKKLPCHTALEHFGTLPQSLQLLEGIDIEYIKLDHSLIHDLAKNPGNAAKLQAAITAAHQRKIKVIAVAVQDAQTLSTLWHYHIDHIQGNFLQKPAPELCFDFSQHTL